MIELFDRQIGREALAAYGGETGQVLGIELLTHADGPARGVRVLHARTGSGFSFRVAVDRGFDLVSAEYRGVPVGWQSPVGIQNPALHAPEHEAGLGFLRSFTGLLATCGLDHFGGVDSGGSEHFINPHRKSMGYPLHGRASQIPARLLGYGVDWGAGTVWCEGLVRQAALFGEFLELARRIEAPLGGRTIVIRDVVTNRGFRPTPHMLLYHFNFGYPLLDEDAELLVPTREVAWTSHEPRAQGVGFRRQVGPRTDFVEQVYQHVVSADASGRVPAALVNRRLGPDGVGVAVEFDHTELPCLLEWQCLQSGVYALGIEPCTHNVAGRHIAEERAETIWLEHGDTRAYAIELSVLAGAGDLDALAGRIAGIQPPIEEMIEPTGRWPRLRD
ncbi:MAG: aldose 1-epimerase family protein [Alphaproteobacteria bacterium]